MSNRHLSHPFLSISEKIVFVRPTIIPWNKSNTVVCPKKQNYQPSQPYNISYQPQFQLSKATILSPLLRSQPHHRPRQRSSQALSQVQALELELELAQACKAPQVRALAQAWQQEGRERINDRGSEGITCCKNQIQITFFRLKVNQNTKRYALRANLLS